MYSMEEFTQKIADIANMKLGESYKVKVHTIEKINTGKQTALIIMDSRGNVSPNFYPGSFYSGYISGVYTIAKVADIVINEYHSIKGIIQDNKETAMHLSEKEWVNERLFIQLINNNQNTSFLNDAVYSDYAGLSLVLYVLVSDDGDGIAKVKVTKNMCRNFGWEEKEILAYALENTVKLFPAEVCTIEKRLGRFMNIEAGDITITDSQDFDGNGLMVLSNKRGMYGATAVFYPGVLRNIAEKKGTGLFLIPSSIHEFIVIADNGLYAPQDLENMLMEVNSTEVTLDEILSDNLYYYSYENGRLSILNAESKEQVVL